MTGAAMTITARRSPPVVARPRAPGPRPAPDPRSLPWALLRSPLVFLDVETTGVGADDRIIELALIRVAPGEATRSLDTLVHPEGRPIHARATAIHGLRAPLLANAPCFGDLRPEVEELLAGAEVVAHNAPFDLRFLGAALARLGAGQPPAGLCTLRLARALLPARSGPRSLDALCARFGVPAYGHAHAAWADARRLPELLVALLSAAGSRESAQAALSAARCGVAAGVEAPLFAGLRENALPVVLRSARDETAAESVEISTDTRPSQG